MPSILDGQITEDGLLPTYADHPRNLFTLLGGEVPVTSYESVTSLCPPDVCAEAAPQPLTQALEDASVVYGHRVLPGTLRDGLPPIDNSWGAYGAQEDGGAVATTTSATPTRAGSVSTPTSAARSARPEVLSEHIAAITADPSLHFVHVAIPHRPWVLSPSGFATSYAPELIRDPADPAYDFENRMEYQLHSMQVGAVGHADQRVARPLGGLPNWDETLLVVTSDHGSNLTPPDLGRMRITDAEP